ncbi:piggyBac transposable element-derived protein 4-like, partial [Diabrotica virgifera virgifera]|uniref:PiggyBac transposable element-derived protein domain-containing protein n=1 Tax=Diabrotica virgifera virgifera TaxID=50390 RepID=A0ABM5JPW3_DIAVI
MACSSNTSRKRKREKTKVSMCGLAEADIDRILDCLDSDENPYIDSGSEFQPTDSEASSEEEIDHMLCTENHSDSEDEINEMAANDEQKEAQAVRNALPENFSVNWTKGKFIPQIHNFDDKTAGACLENTEVPFSELDYFLLFMNDEVVNMIITQTNKYALEQTHLNTKITWTAMTKEDFFTFIAVLFLAARHRKNKLVENWSTDELLYTPIFGKVMSRNRFQIILRMLHFADNAQQIKGHSFHKLRGIFEKIKNTFAQRFSPFQNLVIDESLMLFKGRLLFKQFIRTKRHRFGIKLFLLCDCETGYVLNFIVYTGSKTEIELYKDLGISGSVVTTLMKSYLDKGHSLFTYNWYTSPTLSTYLFEHKTNTCGTVRTNRKQMPDLSGKLEKGETKSMVSDNMLAVRWKDRRDVNMLTTFHKDQMINVNKTNMKTGESVKKPECVVHYNQNMGAVDRTDMMLSSTECVRKTLKWYKKLFFHILDLCVLNSHALFLMQNPGQLPLADFQLRLTRQLLESYNVPKTIPRTLNTSKHQRLTGRHFPAMVPNKKVRRCIVCSQS